MKSFQKDSVVSSITKFMDRRLSWKMYSVVSHYQQIRTCNGTCTVTVHCTRYPPLVSHTLFL